MPAPFDSPFLGDRKIIFSRGNAKPTQRIEGIGMKIISNPIQADSAETPVNLEDVLGAGPYSPSITDG